MEQMALDRLLRVDRLWSWLPAFRAVAELEHLGRAAEALRVSPSAVSRTIRLLEAELGTPLFHRRGRGIQLDDEGALLLEHVRDAMRWVHEAVTRLEEPGAGAAVLRIGASGVAAQVHLPRLLDRLLASRPDLEPHVTTPAVADIAGDLQQGRLDLALCSAAIAGPGLAGVALARVTNGVYCGPGHALHGRAGVSEEEVLEHAFAAPPPNALGGTDEGWPAGRPRRIACRLDRMTTGVEACARGNILAVLPDVLARQHARGLWRLDVPVDDTPVHAIHRRPLGEADRVEGLVAILREVDAALSEDG